MTLINQLGSNFAMNLKLASGRQVTAVADGSIRANDADVGQPLLPLSDVSPGDKVLVEMLPIASLPGVYSLQAVQDYSIRFDRVVGSVDSTDPDQNLLTITPAQQKSLMVTLTPSTPIVGINGAPVPETSIQPGDDVEVVGYLDSATYAMFGVQKVLILSTPP